MEEIKTDSKNQGQERWAKLVIDVNKKGVGLTLDKKRRHEVARTQGGRGGNTCSPTAIPKLYPRRIKVLKRIRRRGKATGDRVTSLNKEALRERHKDHRGGSPGREKSKNGTRKI